MRRASDFRSAVRSGRRARRGCVVVHVRGGDTAADGFPAVPARIGLVVSRAVGGAVVRNRVKRRLRAQLATMLPTVTPGCQVVVRSLPSAAVASSAELGSDLRRALVAAAACDGRGPAASGRTAP